MATTVVPKRSSRLRSREHSIKILSETKSKPRKVNIVNKSIQKVNITARRLRPRQNKKNYCEDSKLLQKYVSKKQQNSIVMLEKLNVDNKKVPVYKTLKSDQSLEEKNDIYDFKFDANDTKERLKRKPRKKNMKTTRNKITGKTRFKKKIELSKTEAIQTIKESGSKNRKDKHVNKIEIPKLGTNVQIIKESMTKDVDQIEIPRIDVQTVEETENKEQETENKEQEIEIDTKLETDAQVVQNSMKEDAADNVIWKTDSITQSVEKTIVPEETFSLNENRKQDTKKPKIVSIKNADNIIVTKTLPGNTEDSSFRPFQPKNIFDNKISNRRAKHTLNSLSITESLSPIMKMSNNPNFGSPWQPPTFPMFSQAKHFGQSTPNVSMEINNENVEENKENCKMNIKENKQKRTKKNKERKTKTNILCKKHIIPKEFSTNQNPNKIQTVFATKTVEQSAPFRISAGKIKTFLQEKSDDNKLVMNEIQVEADKSVVMQEHLNYLNFSDTFDVMSEIEKQSNLETNVPLFLDLEPSHFSKPPRYSYKRKREVRFNFSEDDNEKEGEKDAEMKKKKITKAEKQHQKRVNEWVKSINSTFEEIDNYDLMIE